MFEQANSGQARNVMGDWALRGFIGLAALLVGWAKFDGRGEWPSYFQQLGLGQWFRYFTGVVELLGGILVLAPPTAPAGSALLTATMVGATAANWVVHPGNCVVTALLAIALGLYTWMRWAAPSRS